MPTGYTCLVCDYPYLSEPPRSEIGGGSFEICPSCGFQFGVNDDDEGISYETWRKRWEADGMKWQSFNIKQPANWHPVAKGPSIGVRGAVVIARAPESAKPAARENPVEPAAAPAAKPAKSPAKEKPAAPARKAAKKATKKR